MNLPAPTKALNFTKGQAMSHMSEAIQTHYPGAAKHDTTRQTAILEALRLAASHPTAHITPTFPVSGDDHGGTHTSTNRDQANALAERGAKGRVDFPSAAHTDRHTVEVGHQTALNQAAAGAPRTSDFMADEEHDAHNVWPTHAKIAANLAARLEKR